MPKPQGLLARSGEIRRRRTDAGLSVTELARRVEISHGHMSNVENGRRRAAPGPARAIADALATTVPALFTE